MKPSVAILAILILAATQNTARAAEGDTIISVFYKTNTVRARPTPRTGSATVDFRIVLHRNGTVEDAYAVKGGQKGASKTKLGKQPRNFVYRFIDNNKIERSVISALTFTS